MRRRAFISLIGGAVAAPSLLWPLAARAQQREQARRIGVLVPAVADDPIWQARLGAFLQGLALLGWTIGRNVRVDTRWGTPNTGGRIGRARARRHPRRWGIDHGAIAAGDPHRADRVHARQ